VHTYEIIEIMLGLSNELWLPFEWWIIDWRRWRMSVFGAHSGRKRDIAEVPENANSWKSPAFSGS
jgi:hypothetical protein